MLKRKINYKKILKIVGITFLSFVLLISVLLFSFRLPAVQNFVKGKLVTYLEDKIKTEVKLDRVYVGFPNSLVMENLYLKGQKVDTLLYVRKFDVGLDILGLINSKADITAIDLQGVKANVVRNPDGTFNFDYILNAFASNKEEEKKESKPFIISLDKINLQDIGISFIDQQSRNDINLYFKSFDTRVKKFDLEQNSYAIGDINLDGLKLKLKQDLVEEVSENVDKQVDSLNQKKPMTLDLNGIKFTNFDIAYGDDNTKTFAKVIFQELSTNIKKLDLQNNDYNVENLLLKGANINANLFLAKNSNQKTEEKPQNSSAEKAMKFLLGELVLDDVKVVYNNTAAGNSPGMDFNHLNFTKLNLDLEDFKMENGTFAGNVNSAEIKEKSGLNIQKFTTDFVYEQDQAYLKNLYLQTPKTVLRDQIVLNYNSIEQLSSNPSAVKIAAIIRNSKIGFSDILTFVPTLRNTAPFNKYSNASLNLDTKITGTLNDLLIDHLQVSGLDQLKLSASGKIRNAMDPEKLYYDLKIGELSTSAKTIFNLVPKGTIPSNFSLPSFMTLKGTARGTTKIVNTNFNFTSTLGNAKILADVNMTQKNRELYDIHANLQNLQIGKIIQNKELGSFTGRIEAKGQGFDPKTMRADLKGNVNSFTYKNYRYTNMNLDGKINRGAYVVTLNSKDPNANLKLAASGVMNENNPSVKVNGSIIKLDLQKLGFYAKPMIIAGNLDGDFSNLNPDFLNGTLSLNNFAISDTKEVFPLQNIFVKAVSTDSLNQIILNSQIADLDLSGKYKLSQIFGALQQTVNQYYQFQPKSKQKINPHQYFSFNATVKDDDLIRKFVPELKSFETITLNGNYDADTQKLEVDGKMPQVLYGENEIENGVLKITNENNALQYNLNVASLKSASFALNKVDIHGDVANNTINYDVSTKDEKDVTQFLIAGNAKSLNDITEISLNPNGLKLNYYDWTVDPNNQIRIGKNGIFADQFRLTNQGSEILLQSESTAANSPLNVSLKDFKIESLTEMIKKDSLLAKGTINGTAQLKNLTKEMTFTSDLNVSDLFVYGSPVGNLAIKVNNQTSKILNANIALSGNNNDVKITGTYNTSASAFDLDLNINQLQMQTLQGFTMNAIEETEGYLSGKLDIMGTTENPNILGNVKFNNVGMLIAKTGSDFRKMNDEIEFTSRGIEFDDFKINDKTGNSMTIDGQVLTQNYRDFAFNLDAKARDFKVVNSEKSNDAMMYGILAIDADLDIRGDLDLPKVDGRLAVTDETNFTFVLPQSSPTLQEREGIVEFIDQDQVAMNKTIKTDSLDAQSDIKGMDVSVNIEVNKEAKISLIIDKANGDFVELQGEAELTGGIDPSGKTTLVGVYEVEKGGYELSVSMLKRRFDIEKGSTITWTGEPTTANLNITAVYKTKAAPIDLVEQQMAGTSAAEMNQYKQQIPFNTLLKLNGELLKPEITFDITMEDSNPGVPTAVLDNTKAKLNQIRQDQNDMNKQVFALLLLNRFIGENPFQSEGGLSTSTLVMQSVSKILSQQLNNLASDLIQGVDLNFDLQSSEDYSSGARNERTDLNVGISKKLLNDRLKVSVGSNFGVMGDARQNEQMTNIAGDVTLDYMISRDGRYMLRAYRKNEYQIALQGQIVETGLGFVITLDYDKFKEIFEKSKRNRSRKKNKENQVVEFK